MLFQCNIPAGQPPFNEFQHMSTSQTLHLAFLSFLLFKAEHVCLRLTHPCIARSVTLCDALLLCSADPSVLEGRNIAGPHNPNMTAKEHL